MKRKNICIITGAIATAVICTFAAFSNPTDKDQEQCVFTNAPQQVATSTDETTTVLSEIQENAQFASPYSGETDSSNTKTNEIAIASISDSEQAKEITDTPNSSKKESKKSSNESKKSSAEKSKEDDGIITAMSISKKSCKSSKVAISIADSYVNIRKKPGTDSSIVGKLYKHNAATILKKKGDWYYISSGNVKGYIKSDYVKTNLSQKQLMKYGKLMAIVNTDGLNVRKTASTKADRVDVVYLNEIYPVLKQTKKWAKINIKDDKVKGYVKKEFVKLQIKFKEAISIEEEIALQKAKEAKKEQAAPSSSSSNPSTSAPNTTSSSTNYSAEDLKLLVCLIHSEAGSESYDGKLAVANIVLNRVKSSKYPNNIHDVIYQRGQFSVVPSGSFQKQLNAYSNYSSTSQRLSIQAAKDAFAGMNNIGSRLSFNHYTKAIANSHSSGIKIDNQFFW